MREGGQSCGNKLGNASSMGRREREGINKNLLRKIDIYIDKVNKMNPAIDFWVIELIQKMLPLLGSLRWGFIERRRT